MHRLFVALTPPADIRSRLLGLMSGVDGARWQDDAQLHCTLRFIGNVDGRVAEDVATALASLAISPVEAAVHGVGTFESRGAVHTIWAGLTAHAALGTMKQRIDARLRPAGIVPDERRFTPHITLARLARSAGPVGEWIADHAALSSPPFTMTRMTLFESHLRSEGAHYKPIAHYPLM